MARKLNTKAFAEYLSKWLEQNNTTQYDLAKRSEISPGTIHNWITGKTTKKDLALLDALADGTGVPLSKWISLLTDKPLANTNGATNVAPNGKAMRGLVKIRKRRT